MSRNSGPMLGTLGRLFSRGTVTGLGEGELLDRFVADRDEAAFAVLVARHGPMVLGVCRRILRDERDIEDAFQATFLILVRRAGAIRDGQRVGHWLHGVAHRVAVRSRANAARQYIRERPVNCDLESSGRPVPSIVGDRELFEVLDEELARLPGALRSPMVLCYLEGLTHDEAASRLGWPVGTVRSRMARARSLLHRRLSRRGVMASGAVLPGSLARTTVPIALLDATVKISSSFATKSSLAAAVASLTATGLANEVLHAMMLTRITVIAATGLTCALTLGGPTVARQFAGDKGHPVQIEQGAGPMQIALADPPSAATAEVKPDTVLPPDAKTESVHPEGSQSVDSITMDLLRRKIERLGERDRMLSNQLKQSRQEVEDARKKMDKFSQVISNMESEQDKLRLEVKATKEEMTMIVNKGYVEHRIDSKLEPKGNSPASVPPAPIAAPRPVNAPPIPAATLPMPPSREAAQSEPVAEGNAERDLSPEKMKQWLERKKSLNMRLTVGMQSREDLKNKLNDLKAQINKNQVEIRQNDELMQELQIDLIKHDGLLASAKNQVKKRPDAGESVESGGLPKPNENNIVDESASKRSEQTQIWRFDESLIGASSAWGDRVSIKGPLSGKPIILKLFDVTEPKHRVTPIWNRDSNGPCIALHIDGPQIKRVAVFCALNPDVRAQQFKSAPIDAWYPEELREAVDGIVSPIMNRGIVAYPIGRHVYAFSTNRRSWDVLTLQPGSESQKLVKVLENRAEVEQDGHIYSFPNGRGKWSDLDVTKLLDEPEDVKPGAGTSK